MMKKDIEVLEIENFSEPDTSLLGLDEELKTKQRRKTIIKVISTILVIILLVFLVLYGPYKGFKNWLIDNASNNKFIGITTFLYVSGSVTGTSMNSSSDVNGFIVFMRSIILS